MYYRKKPVIIEAFQLLNKPVSEMPDWIFENDDIRLTDDSNTKNPKGDIIRMCITTWEGNMYANEGDWIIKGVKGEIYPCKPDIFKATYEPVI